MNDELNDLLSAARFMDVCHRNYLATGTGIETYIESIQDFDNKRREVAADLETKNYLGLAIALQSIAEELERIVQSDSKSTEELEAVYSALMEIIEHTKEPALSEAN